MIRLDTTRQVVHVYSEDPAIDTKSGDYNYQKFLDTGDLKYVPAIPGEKLSLFYVERLPHKKYISLSGLYERARMEALEIAVRFGLKRVENCEVGGNPLQLEFHGEGPDRGLTEECFGRLFEPGLVNQLGYRILGLSSMRASPLSSAG